MAAYPDVDCIIIGLLHPEVRSVRISGGEVFEMPDSGGAVPEDSYPRIIPATGYEARYETTVDSRTTRTHYPVVAIAIDGTSGQALVLNKSGKLVEPNDSSMKDAGKFSRVVPAKWSDVKLST
jgi:hypothetical protein